ncbi:hypothetical protein FHS01_004314 [Longimicrobium terrae]|uniref:Uncharacterized protein n=1 Tax=Longimicrobium terrae TaxID=1639882 RepID=A0A841H7F3_9BACT|nr:hypothetical protein [Longimicrobium terrae]MBB6073776.1 hypothetical protein [Longimicrobium terrae]
MIRFPNEAVLQDLDVVLSRIQSEAEARIRSSPPSPAERVEGGRGGGGLSAAPNRPQLI